MLSSPILSLTLLKVSAAHWVSAAAFGIVYSRVCSSMGRAAILGCQNLRFFHTFRKRLERSHCAKVPLGIKTRSIVELDACHPYRKGSEGGSCA